MQLKLIDIVSLVKSLVVRTFPAVNPVDTCRLIDLCHKNYGLAFAPIDNPDFVFGYFHYWPQLVDFVENWNWDELERHDLKAGPILHIGVLITPTPGYRITRDLIGHLDPLGVSCNRYRKNGDITFHFKQNPRFTGKASHEVQH